MSSLFIFGPDVIADEFFTSLMHTLVKYRVNNIFKGTKNYIIGVCNYIGDISEF